MLPAVHHHWASVRRCRGFDSSYKSQKPSSMIGHTVLRPGCEVELTHLMLGWVSSLPKSHKISIYCMFRHNRIVDTNFTSGHVSRDVTYFSGSWTTTPFLLQFRSFRMKPRGTAWVQLQCDRQADRNYWCSRRLGRFLIPIGSAYQSHSSLLFRVKRQGKDLLKTEIPKKRKWKELWSCH